MENVKNINEAETASVNPFVSQYYAGTIIARGAETLDNLRFLLVFSLSEKNDARHGLPAGVHNGRSKLYYDASLFVDRMKALEGRMKEHFSSLSDNTIKLIKEMSSDEFVASYECFRETGVLCKTRAFTQFHAGKYSQSYYAAERILYSRPIEYALNGYSNGTKQNGDILAMEEFSVEALREAYSKPSSKDEFNMNNMKALIEYMEQLFDCYEGEERERAFAQLEIFRDIQDRNFLSFNKK